MDCDWSHPGINPMTVRPSSVLVNYADIPPDIRKELVFMLDRRIPSEIIEIGRDRIGDGKKYTYARDMHWGAGKLCKGPVSRAGWKPSHRETIEIYKVPGMVHPVALARTCGNVFRLTDIKALTASGPNLAATPPRKLFGVEIPGTRQATPVPEPSSLLLVGTAILALLAINRRIRRG